MSPERWAAVDRLYHAALARPVRERAAFLAEACAGDEELRREVESLLAQGASAEAALTRGAVVAAAGLVTDIGRSVLAGRRLGTYQILAPLGAGGMGEVYRARDTRLGRDVAIKILPRAFTADADRLARFEREARVLASLNHPHIAAIYGIEDAPIDSGPQVRALVLELVEGETLGDRITRAGSKGLPVKEALDIARQIADALDAAHEKGIVHRDLKPANIKITPQGIVKVLDFGLAKLESAAKGQAAVRDATEAPTITVDDTREGVLVGTAAYMSPEQARGQAVDKRTDIWAFGCVLYEMLTGRGAFNAPTLSDTLARVLEREPDWQQLPRRTPARIRDLLHRCLEKEPGGRLNDLQAARRDIKAYLTPFEMSLALLASIEWRTSRRFARWSLAALAIAIAGVIVYPLRDRPVRPPELASPTQITSAIGVEDYPSPSPDGRTVVYESNETGNWDIWVAQVTGEHVNRTADHSGDDDRFPSWSPDGRQIAFWSNRDGGGYFVMPALAGDGQKIIATETRVSQFFYSPPAWSADGSSLAAVNYETAGTSTQAFVEIVSLATQQSRRIALPGGQPARIDLSWSRDGAYLAYVDFTPPTGEVTQLRILRLADSRSTALTDGGTNDRSPRFWGDGRYLYYVSNRLGATDLWRQRLTADGTRTDDPDRITTGLDIRHIAFSVDQTKVVYSKGRWISNVWRVPIRTDRPANWMDAQQLTFEQAFIEFMDVSRDGQRLVFSSDRGGNQDLWTMKAGGGEASPLTRDPTPDWNPRWSTDSRRIAFYGYRTREREIWVVPAGGGPALQLTHRLPTSNRVNDPPLDFNGAPDWSPDGASIAFASTWSGNTDIWVVPSTGGNAHQLTTDPAADNLPAWSPDGRWLAFSSNRGGTNHIWRMKPEGAMAERLTSTAGRWPRWSPDGEAIYFIGDGPQSGNLWALSLKDRSERQLTNLADRRGSLGIQGLSTDGKYLYFAWRDDLGDIWSMDVLEP